MNNEKTKQLSHHQRSTLSTQLTVRIVLFVAVSVIVMTTYSVYTIQNNITKLSIDALRDESLSCTNNLMGWINARLSFMDCVATTIKHIDFDDDAAMLKYFDAAIANEQSGASDIFIGSKDGWF